MKNKKYPELLAIKGKMREKKVTYRELARKIGMSTNTLNSRLNGYSVCDIEEVNDIAIELGIGPNEIVKYFFPSMLRNETNFGNDDEEAAIRKAI